MKSNPNFDDINLDFQDIKLEPLELGELEPLEVEDLEPLDITLEPLDIELDNTLFDDIELKGFEDIELTSFGDIKLSTLEELGGLA